MTAPVSPDHEPPLDQRRAGLLAPVFAMRHEDDLGIGDTRAVREAIDFCAEHGFQVLQILPIHETFGDHSPYNPISSRALSPSYIYLHPEEVPGLKAEDLERAAPPQWQSELRTGIVKHGSVHALKIQILLRGWERFRSKRKKSLAAAFEAFQTAHASWLPRYTLFRLLIREYEGFADWTAWRPEHRAYESAEEWLANHPDRKSLERIRAGFAYIQWIAQRQWQAVRDHADARGIYLMGEISFGVGRGSVDVWGHPDLFDLDWSMGTAPLAHFDTSPDAAVWGQNWGLPAYRWEHHRRTGFAWLRGRVARQREFFHLCRLDHLRGYFRIYRFPWHGGARHSEFSALTPEQAALRTGGKLPEYVPGPDHDPVLSKINEAQGRELIGVLMDEAGPMQFVAELMGEMPDYMRRALEEIPVANLAFPQLARLDQDDPARAELRELALATYANHDNAPLALAYVQWHTEARRDPTGKAARELEWMLGFAGWKSDPPDTLDDDLLDALQRALLGSKSRLAVFMSSDLLGLPTRFNLPGSFGLETWCERLPSTFRGITEIHTFRRRLERVRGMIDQTGRLASSKRR